MDQQNQRSLFYERIKKLALSKGQSFNHVERHLGYSRNALSNYKYSQSPSAVRLLDLSKYFNVTPEYLMGKSSNPLVIEPTSYFGRLSNQEKYQILMLSQTWMLENLHQTLLAPINKQTR